MAAEQLKRHDPSSPLLNQLVSALWWSLDLLDAYDDRLRAIGEGASVDTPTHTLGKATARLVLEQALADVSKKHD